MSARSTPTMTLIWIWSRKRPNSTCTTNRGHCEHISRRCRRAKFIHGDAGESGVARRGEAHECLVSAGCIISGGVVRRSVLSPNVRVNSYAVVEDSVLMDGVDVGRHCRVKRAIIDKGVKLPPHTVVGHDLVADRRRGFAVSDAGVVVVAKGEVIE